MTQLESISKQSDLLIKDFLTNWINALRSGQYTQTKREWKNNEGCFCATGVALEISNRGVWEKSEYVQFTNSYAIKGDTFSLKKLRPISNLIHPEIDIDIEDLLFVRDLFSFSVNLNDTGKTFEEIADSIEDECIRMGFLEGN